MQAKIFTDLDQKDEEATVNGRALCPDAVRFLAWAQQMCEEHTRSALKIAQGKVLLVDKYYEWRNSVPKAHRIHTGERGHYCIWHVAFEFAYPKLRQAELALTPPMLFIPPPPPGRAQFDGIFLGEDEGT